jgi:hypothetical protein
MLPCRQWDKGKGERKEVADYLSAMPVHEAHAAIVGEFLREG